MRRLFVLILALFIVTALLNAQGPFKVVTTLLSGVLTSGRVPFASTDGVLTDSAALTFSGGTLWSTTFSGSGASLTSLNASNISSGELADARLSSQVAHLNVNETVNASWAVNGSLKIDTTNGRAILGVLSTTASLDFPSTDDGSVSVLTISVAGAAVGDAVFIGLPDNIAGSAGAMYEPFVFSSGIVRVLFKNKSGFTIDPAAGMFRAVVFKF